MRWTVKPRYDPGKTWMFLLISFVHSVPGSPLDEKLTKLMNDINGMDNSTKEFSKYQE